MTAPRGGTSLIPAARRRYVDAVPTRVVSPPPRPRARAGVPLVQLRLNPLTGGWVTIAVDRDARPGDLISRQLPVQADPSLRCPFCRGNEEASPPALETYDRQGEWVVRIVPNRYPAFDGDEPLRVHNLGPVFTQAAASGIHEVLVFTPDHGGSWADLDDAQAAVTMAAIRDRRSATRRSSSTTAARRGPASSTHTASCSASRSCRARSPRRRPGSAASRGRA